MLSDVRPAVHEKIRVGLHFREFDPRVGLEKNMDSVNEIHRYLSGFIGSHLGFSRKELQDWLNLFCFYWNTPGDAFQKAQAFIELAVKKRKILRYRSWGMAKSADKS